MEIDTRNRNGGPAVICVVVQVGEQALVGPTAVETLARAIVDAPDRRTAEPAADGPVWRSPWV